MEGETMARNYAAEYAARIARGISRGFSRSQSRGHARTARGERTVSDVKSEARATQEPLAAIPKSYAPQVTRPSSFREGFAQKRIKDTEYFEVRGNPNTLRIRRLIEDQRQDGKRMVRVIYQKPGQHGHTTGWMSTADPERIIEEITKQFSSSGRPTNKGQTEDIIDYDFGEISAIAFA